MIQDIWNKFIRGLLEKTQTNLNDDVFLNLILSISKMRHEFLISDGIKIVPIRGLSCLATFVEIYVPWISAIYFYFGP